jgi:hypothetical protein
MQRFKRIALMAVAILVIPPAAIALYVARLELEERHFYQERPMLNAMWGAHLRGRDGSSSKAAEEALLRVFAPRSARATAAAALSAAGFFCQTSPLRPAAIDCQLRAPADVGYTLWIIDLYADELGELSAADVVIGGISF